MIYMRDSSTGGSDFITMSIRVLNPHLTIGNITFAMDAFIVLLGTVLVSRDMDSLIYGVIVSYLMSIVVDKTMYGIDRGKVTLIVTNTARKCARKSMKSLAAAPRSSRESEAIPNIKKMWSCAHAIINKCTGFVSS